MLTQRELHRPNTEMPTMPAVTEMGRASTSPVSNHSQPITSVATTAASVTHTDSIPVHRDFKKSKCHLDAHFTLFMLARTAHTERPTWKRPNPARYSAFHRAPQTSDSHRTPSLSFPLRLFWSPQQYHDVDFAFVVACLGISRAAAPFVPSLPLGGQLRPPRVPSRFPSSNHSIVSMQCSLSRNLALLCICHVVWDAGCIRFDVGVNTSTRRRAMSIHLIGS
ncbi:hypothetical protein BD310DRAFT_932807 [Dichomitus squalens]|uniref:Uncharacterized protein n=1 Tax=Dichomitus squalens TaxID=114155 RepID=A0A4Q9PNF4_9APHY|nr:hypothetical protein BD310DRAFT_932807 [Dichomitus squalens]